VEQPSTEEPGPADLSLRNRLNGWPTAITIVVVGALVLVTGAVLLWLVVTTLGAFIRTIF
jgi:hypothetical protein